MTKYFTLISLSIIVFSGMVLISCSSKKKAVSAENAIANKKLDIYILMGQSNMSGRGPLIDADSIIQNKNVLMFTKDLKWVLSPLSTNPSDVAIAVKGTISDSFSVSLLILS